MLYYPNDIHCILFYMRPSKNYMTQVLCWIPSQSLLFRNLEIATDQPWIHIVFGSTYSSKNKKRLWKK